jgi:hypothetical protein
MQDNFDQISSLLDFSEPNTFYFIQLLKRRKENPEMKTGVQVIDNFYIYNSSDLQKMKDRIIERCVKHNARAYINLNRLDLEKIAMYTAKTIIDYIIAKDFKSVKNIYATVCGSHHSDKSKKWLIDIDAEFLERKDEIYQIVEKLHEEVTKSNYKILAEIPTKSGVHIITNPFNIEKFRKILLERATSQTLSIDVQKNSTTVLYIV